MTDWSLVKKTNVVFASFVPKHREQDIACRYLRGTAGMHGARAPKIYIYVYGNIDLQSTFIISILHLGPAAEEVDLWQLSRVTKVL